MKKGLIRELPIAIKLLVLVTLALFSMTFFTAITALLLQPVFGINLIQDPDPLINFEHGNTLAAFKFLQVVQAVTLFIIPALIFPWLCGENTADYLKAKKAPSFSLIFLVLLIAYFSSPMVELANQLNQKMSLPDFLNRVEEWMRMKEDQMAELTKAFLKMDTPGQLVFNLFMIAVLPAIGEELLFRGVLQKLLIDSSRNPHAGIWVAAIVFSALHFQFYGFLPRMFLGVLFGYLFYWSGNIWLPIAAHFINNSTVVVVSYLFQHKFINFDVDKASQVSIEAYVACFAISTLLIITFYRKTRSSAIDNYGNELG